MTAYRARLTETDIQRLIKASDDDDRAEAAYKLCRSMDHADLTDDDRAAAQKILRMIAEDAAELVRRAMAVTLKSSDLIPRDVARKLAADVDSVALPMINFSPKANLRHPGPYSTVAEFTSGGFQELIDDTVDATAVKQVLFCTGKIYFDLHDYRVKNAIGNVAIVRDGKAAGRKVREQRVAQKDSFFFNWALHVPLAFQQPFAPTHEAMAALDLHHGRKPHELAADLRRAFSGIVAGNVKEEGMREIERHGPYIIDGDKEIMRALDGLLKAFVAQRRMKISGSYKPCYQVANG